MSVVKPVLLAVLIMFAANHQTEGAESADDLCSVGLFEGPGDAFLVITQTAGGHAYAFSSGEVGRIQDTEAQVACLQGAVQVLGDQIWPQAPLIEKDTVFQSRGVDLVGRLLEPSDGPGSGPLVVFAHGSERTGWLDRAQDPYQLVGRGISVFVYDKRGTGLSGGRYTQNVPLLADDLIAASAEARRLAEGRYDRFGLIGLSQGGWVVPFAANRADADFVAVGYGLVMDIREEDAAQVAQDLRDAGYGEDVIAQAREITDATARLATDATRAALVSLEAIRIRYAEEPWFPLVRGDYTGILLSASMYEIETEILPTFEDYNIDWSIDPVAVVRDVAAPQLWVFAGSDRAAPIDLSLERLTALRASGQNITIRVFPQTDHGMWEFTTTLDGTRTFTRVTPGYHDLMADWSHGAMQGPYGSTEPR